MKGTIWCCGCGRWVTTSHVCRVREDPALASAAFRLHELGFTAAEVASRLAVSGPTVVNLIGLGRRLAAGQGEAAQWD